MKKTILAILTAVMVATPCFANEIEPEGIFSLHGTLWQALPIGLQTFPIVMPLSNSEFCFYGGKVYPAWVFDDSFYIDMLVCSIFWGVDGHGAGGGSDTWYYGILQPIGIGVVFQRRLGGGKFTIPYINVGLLIKTENNWVPPEFGSISPNQGEQGETLIDVTITGINTNIDDVIGIRFVRRDGSPNFMVSNINVISDTEVEFDLEIPIDATIGPYYVSMGYYDEDSRYNLISADDAFEVLPKTK
jgi:hypothetical protein